MPRFSPCPLINVSFPEPTPPPHRLWWSDRVTTRDRMIGHVTASLRSIQLGSHQVLSKNSNLTLIEFDCGKRIFSQLIDDHCSIPAHFSYLSSTVLVATTIVTEKVAKRKCNHAARVVEGWRVACGIHDDDEERNKDDQHSDNLFMLGDVFSNKSSAFAKKKKNLVWSRGNQVKRRRFLASFEFQMTETTTTKTTISQHLVCMVVLFSPDFIDWWVHVTRNKRTDTVVVAIAVGTDNRIISSTQRKLTYV